MTQSTAATALAFALIGAGLGLFAIRSLDAADASQFRAKLQTELTREGLHPTDGDFLYTWPDHCTVEPRTAHSVLLHCDPGTPPSLDGQTH